MGPQTTNVLTFRQAKRIQQSVSAAYEKRLLIWMAERTPAWISSHHLTGLGFAGQLLTGFAYAMSAFNRAWLIAGIVFLRHWNFSKVALLENVLDLITAALVFYDASRKHISKALRWALGSLFLWVVFFPWYLARRRELQKPCPLVEAEASPLMRGLVFLLFLYFVLGMLLVITQKFPK